MAFVTFTFNPVPKPACYPPDINGLAELLTDGGVLSGTIPDNSGASIFFGSNPPPSALASQLWIKLDGASRPLGLYTYYNGNWRKVYTNTGIGEIRMFFGLSTSPFDGTGRGVVGGDMDGWALCNGQNGTPNMNDHFPCAGSPNGSGGWHANPDGLGGASATGGQGTFQIAAGNLPELHVGTNMAIRATGGGDWTLTPSFSTQGDQPRPEGVVGTGNNTAIDNCPPWRAIGFIMFIGYA